MQNPSIWYAIDLRTQDGSFDVEGVTFAGAPGIVIGHNPEHCLGRDQSRPRHPRPLVEKLDAAATPASISTWSQWLPLTVVTETIQVKGQRPTWSLPVRMHPSTAR